MFVQSIYEFLHYMTHALMVNDILYGIATKFEDFQTLDMFARVCRRFALFVCENRENIYSARTEVVEKTVGSTRCVGYYVYGLLHRGNDDPAEILSNGTTRWYRHGLQHRGNDQPAEVEASGSQCWYWRGHLHRDNDLPAEIWADGTKLWRRHGRRHRDGDNPAEIWVNGTPSYCSPDDLPPGNSRCSVMQVWYQDDNIHRDDDKPARIVNGVDFYWFQRGQLHRDGDAPAVMRGNHTNIWYRQGKITGGDVRGWY
jgi:hypothetical protein